MSVNRLLRPTRNTLQVCSQVNNSAIFRSTPLRPQANRIKTYQIPISRRLFATMPGLDANQGGDANKKTYNKKATGEALKTAEAHSAESDLKLYGSCFWYVLSILVPV